MKNLYLRVLPVAIALSFSISFEAKAQYSRLKNSSSSQIGVGFSDAGLLLNAYYIKSFDQKFKAAFGGGLIFGKVSDINYKSLFIDGMGSYSLYGNRLVFINAVAGISFVGDYKNQFPSDEYNKQFSFNYGVLGGLEAEFIASRKVSFVLAANQRYYIKKDFGHFRYQASAGIRFAF